MNYSIDELYKLGFLSVGTNVKWHRHAIFINPGKISIGNNVRIDAFCLISAGEKGVEIGNNVHIAAGAYIFGSAGRVGIGNFCGLSSRTTIYTSTDDYVEGHLTNPTVPDRFKKVAVGDVVLKTHALVGASSVIMPGVVMEYGSACGAMTFVSRNLKEFELGVGNPMRVIKKRGELLRTLEKEYLASE